MKLFASSLSQGSSTPIQDPLLKRLRYGADYIISNNTDTYSTNAMEVEYLSYKYGIRGTVFETASISNVNREVYTMNIFECSIYWPTDTYYNGNNITSIPDYYSGTWSSSGVAAFPNAVLGAAKPLRYPNIGTQQMYMSGGLIGVQLDVLYTDWDKGIGNEGLNNPSKDPDESASAVIIATGTNGDGLQGMLGYLNTSPQGNKSYSYRNGQEGTWQVYAKYMLQGRNSTASVYSDNQWFDTFLKSDRIDVSCPSTTRIVDTTINPDYTFQESVNKAESELNLKTIPNSNWYNNFAHWHSTNMGDFETFYTMLRSVIDANTEFVWLAGMSEAVSYNWFADMITNVSFNGSVISVAIDNVNNIDLSLISCPVSIEIDLTGTGLQGKNIQSNNGRVRNLGSDRFIVEIFADSLQTAIIETASPDYYNFDNPSVTGESFVTDTLTIDTDMLTVATLFSDTSGTIVERKTSNSLQHIFTGLSTGQTYYLGIMSRENKSIIQTINT